MCRIDHGTDRIKHFTRHVMNFDKKYWFFESHSSFVLPVQVPVAALSLKLLENGIGNYRLSSCFTIFGLTKQTYEIYLNENNNVPVKRHQYLSRAY